MVDKISSHFSEGQIQGFMKDLQLSYIETILYLWFYNNVGICTNDLKKDNGRAMYLKFAKSVAKLIKEDNIG